MNQSTELITCSVKLSGRRNSDYFEGVGFVHIRNTGRETCTEEVSQCTTLRNHLGALLIALLQAFNRYKATPLALSYCPILLWDPGYTD